jgi:predicted Zn-dependent protease
MAAQAFNMTGQMAPLESAMARLAGLQPDSAETWYDLAGVRAVLGRKPESVAALSNAVRLSDARLKADGKALDLRSRVKADARFNALNGVPGFSDLSVK